jgi:membrane dipeptidase
MLVDAHLDISYNMWLGRDVLVPVQETRDREGPGGQGGSGEICTVSLPDALAGGVGLVFGSLFTDTTSNPRHLAGFSYSTPEEANSQAGLQLELYQRLSRDPRVLLVSSRADLEALQQARQSAAMLGIMVEMEGAEPVLSPDDLNRWYESGIRQIGLAWAFGNRYCGGNMAPGPLTPAGQELLRQMERLGMILDVSHLADASFWQAMTIFHGPVVASHASCRALVPGPRQLSDDMIKAIVERNGMIGMVMFNAFLKDGWSREQGKEAVTLADVVRHIDRIAQLAGSVDHVGIGSDLDGGLGYLDTPAEIDTIADLPRLAPALAAAGYQPVEVDGILGSNWLRFLEKALPAG